MENENTELNEQQGAAEEIDAFDEGWRSEFEPGEQAEGRESEAEDDFWGDADEGSEEPGTDADQREGTGNTAGVKNAKDGEGSDEGAEGQAETPDQAEQFVLKHLGEEQTVSRDEVVRLAQQGLDYPRIREKWDEVKDQLPQLRMYESFLKELAETRDGDIEGLIDETRTRTIIARAKAQGKNIDPAAAAAQAVKMRIASANAEGKGTGKAKSGTGDEPEAEEGAGGAQGADRDRNDRMIDAFIKKYGSSVKGTDIPGEVWQEAAETGDLVGAYEKFKSRELEAENKRLKTELEQAKQQRKNRERSTGSSRSVGSAAAKDAFDEGWNEAW